MEQGSPQPERAPLAIGVKSDVRDALRAALDAARARPALIAFACVALGYVLARDVVMLASGVWFGAALLGLALAAGLRGWACRTALAVATVALAGGWFTARIHERPQMSLSHALPRDRLSEPALVTVHAVVEDWPIDLAGARGALGGLARTQPACTFSARVHGVENDKGLVTPASGRLAVRVQSPRLSLPPGARPGQALRITGRIEGVRPALNPGEPDWIALARQDARVGTLHVPSVELISPARIDAWPDRARAGLDAALGWLRAGASAAFASALDTTAASIDPASAAPLDRAAQARALLGAMLLGQRSAALDPVSDAFMRQGLVHLVAISGFNLAVMGGVVLFVLRLGRDRGWVDSALLALLIAGYMLVLPADAGILRSGFMMLALLLVEATGRRYDHTSVMGWIGAAILAWRPMDLWSPGFQLSFAIVAALILFSGLARERLFGTQLRGVLVEPVEAGRIRWWRPARWKPWIRGAWNLLKAHIAASVLAWGVATPIIACHTGVISPLAPITGLVVLPLTVVVLWIGYGALLLGAIVPALGTYISPVLEFAAGLLVDVVLWLDAHVGVTLHAPDLSAFWAFAGVLVVLYVITRGRRRSLVAWSLCAALACWTAGELLVRPRIANVGALRLDTLAVGDGTCHLLRSGSDAMLWDCGSLATGVGQRTIPNAVRALGASRVSTILITHAHLDHFAGVLDVIDPLGVRVVLVSHQLQRTARDHPGSGADVLLSALKARAITVRVVGAGDQARLGDCSLSFLWPPPERDFRDPNDASLVAMLSTPAVGPHTPGRRVLMTGDISREAAPSLLPETPAQQDALRADVLELPHHGAFLESKAELVRSVRPEVVVQSTGPVRARDTRWNPLKPGRRWFVTARDGCISVIIAPDGTITTRAFASD